MAIQKKTLSTKTKTTKKATKTEKPSSAVSASEAVTTSCCSGQHMA